MSFLLYGTRNCHSEYKYGASASSSCPDSPAILACPGNEADKQQTQHQQQHQQHRVGDNDNCPLLHGNDLGLSAVPNLHSSQHIALSSSQSVRTETGQCATPCRAVPGDTIYTTLTIKIRGGAATVTSKQQRTQLFLLSYTRSTNLPALTVTGHLPPPSTPHRHAHRWQLAADGVGGAHC